jgi:tripartite-type tricarboxylate transporter receptor subunit TctC
MRTKEPNPALATSNTPDKTIYRQTLTLLKSASFFVLVAMAWLLSPSQQARAQTDSFYKGKSIRIVVGTTSGGAYDRWARLLAASMGKHIPGNPEILVQNMPGANSLVAANYVYNVAKPDGLTLLMASNSLYMDQFVGRSEVRFDVRKFFWLGTPQKYFTMMYMRADAPYKSIRDIIKAKEAPKCGAVGTNSTGNILAKLLEQAVGARFNMVLGYPGSSETDLAVERAEVICRSHDVMNHFSAGIYKNWHKNGFDRHIVQDSPKRDPRLLDTPTLFELMEEYKTPELSRRTAEFVSASAQFGRPMLATPGTPADRVRILRESYAKVMIDPELSVAAKKAAMEIDPSSGEELQELVQRIMDQPAELKEQVKKVIGE